MDQFLRGYDLNLTTWVYLSSLLTIAIYFKFNRLWSIRNLDILALVAMAPGVVLVRIGEDTPDDHSLYVGYIWLLACGGWYLVRLGIDLFMVRRPLLEPNLSLGGMTFIGVALLVFLMVNVVTKSPKEEDLEGLRMLDAMLHREQVPGVDQKLTHQGPGFSLIFLVPSITTKSISTVHPAVPRNGGAYMVQAATARLMAILSHIAVVAGIVMIGVWHFDNIRTGIAAATLYLLLPYTAGWTGYVYHVVPAALLVWAIATYRWPMLSGMLLGLATGAIYYPLFLLPLWLGFYWQRGLLRFTIGYASMLAVLVALLAFISTDFEHFLAQVKMMFGWTDFAAPGVRGFWVFHVSTRPYRLPVLALYVAICASFALWPTPKNLGSLLSCSAAVMLGTQFWQANGGGIYVAWYLPLLLLTIFRPNLEDRIALATLAVWSIRARLRSARQGAGLGGWGRAATVGRIPGPSVRPS
ncbi:MAG TPA: hypothetical protein VG826_03965 [Pirellulales bacterium]|nr:hypothetical protein [Pirellulales bacterium]